MKRKLAFFSPLPPTKSGISDYSLELSFHLKKYFEITFVVGNDTQSPIMIPNDTCFLKYSDWRALRNKKQFICFYHMGNNIFHDYIYDEILDNPGVTLLHDFSLHHLMIERRLNEKISYNDYYKKIHKSLGLDYETNQIKYFTIPELFKFIVPLNDEVIRQSNKIIVHSKKSYNELKRNFPNKQILKINFPYKNSEIEDSSFNLNKKKFGLDEDCLVISTLGFCTPTKQTPFILKALSNIRNKLNNFKFLIVGEVHESVDIEEQISKYKLENNVIVVGYTDLTTFNNYIVISDIVLTLRYPSAGETSAVLFRSLGFGKVNIVFDYESFGDFPDDVLIKIPLNTSDTRFLEGALLKLFDNKSLFNYYRKNSKQYIEKEHDISEIANQLNNFL